MSIKRFTRLVSAAMAAVVLLTGTVGAQTAWDGTVDVSWYAGQGGASQNTYSITTAAQLAGLAQLVNAGNGFSGKTINLVGDINLNNQKWTPIGTGTEDCQFDGIFEGADNEIIGLNTIANRFTGTGPGLFGTVGSNGVVRNIGVSGNNSNVVGVNYGTVSNCYNAGNVTSSIGGVVGINIGTVSNCYNTGNVTGDANYVYRGGVVGQNYAGTVSNCYNIGSVSHHGYADGCAGGVVGLNENGGKVQNCYNTGNVSGGYAGGVVVDNGLLDDIVVSTVSNCYNTGNVTSSSTNGAAGGVVGRNDVVGTVSSSYNTGDIHSSGSNGSTGGVVGSNWSTISNCYNTGKITGVSREGGIAGYNNTGSTVSYCYNTGDVLGRTSGGVVGHLSGGTISNNVSLGLKVNGSNIDARVGYGVSNVSFINNKARKDMLLSDDFTVGWGSADNSEGANVIPDTTTMSSVFSGWSSSVWDIPSGTLAMDSALPTLKAITQSSAPILPIVKYIISFYANYTGGTVTPAKLETDTDWKLTEALPEPKRDGYTFVGWYTTNATTGGDKITEDTEFRAHISVYARWLENLFSGGIGTQSNPYLISTVDDLKLLGDSVNTRSPYSNVSPFGDDKYFLMTKDINLNNEEWMPIGSNKINCQFTGVFDGGNNKITGLKVTSVSTDSDDFLGLFGIVGSKGVIKNLGVSGSVSGGTYAGGLVGKNDGAISNCYNIGDISGRFSTGGVAGQNNGSVSNCYNTGDISGSSRIGGVVGSINSSNGTIFNCYNTGNVSGTGQVGGILGNMVGNYSTVSSSYNTGSVSSTGSAPNYVSSIAGGVVGNASSGTVSNCYNTGDVSGATTSSSNAGGVVGLNLGTLSNNYNIGNVSSYNAGGVVGTVGSSVSDYGANLNDNISLGLNVTGNSARMSRVAGNYINGALTNNKARSDMKVGSNIILTGNATNANGADVLLGAAMSTVFNDWDSEVWDIPAGNLVMDGELPTLKGIAQTQTPALPTVIHTITFNANYTGGTVTPTTAEIGLDGKLAVALPTLTRDGYKFVGWFSTSAVTGGDEVTKNTVFNANSTIYARWTIIKYRITFNANYTGGSVTPEFDSTGTDWGLTFLPILTRTGYSFVGWFNTPEATGGTQITTNTVFDDDAAIYARWRKTIIVSDLSFSLTTVTYNHTARSVAVTTASGVTGLGDITVLYDGFTTAPTDAGTYTITVNITEGSVYASATNMELGYFTIASKSLTDAKVAVEGTYIYTGSEHVPASANVTVSLTGYTPTYNISATDNINAGTATVVVTGTGNFSGTAEGTFTIAARPLTDATVTIGGTYTYTGEAQIPASGNITVTLASYTPTYEVTSVTNNTDAGTATVTITGNGNFGGTATGTFTIQQKPLTADMISIPVVTYNGLAQTPALTVIDGVKTLVNDIDYLVTLTPRTDVGTYAITVAGNGNYSGALSVNFVIQQKPLTADMISISAVTYNGLAQTPALAVIDGAKTLVSDIDYIAILTPRTDVGTYAIAVTSNGNYSGALSVNFVIKPKLLTEDMLHITTVSYNGTHQTPVLTVTDHDIKVLTRNVDYTVTLTPQTNAGIYPITVTGIGNYTGAPSVDFIIGKTIVLSPDRTIPDAGSGTDAVVAAPVSSLAAEFTAGPNPVSKSIGKVGFFYQGKRISSGQLMVYDAVGNVVRKISVKDSKDIMGGVRRIVGEWDLKDDRGRPVAEGTYLLRGVVRTVDGGRERVSLAVGVR